MIIFLTLRLESGNECVVNANCIQTISERSDIGLTSIGLISGRFVTVLNSIDEINSLFEKATKKTGG
jgi:uncharacterized protein YlzI (FlbEa/FlbD family)